MHTQVLLPLGDERRHENLLADYVGHACRGGDAYGGGRRHEMSLAEYLKWWQQHKAGLDDRLLYLKDWHFVSEFPGYQVCAITQIPAT